MWYRDYLVPFWDDEFKTLDYELAPFNDAETLARWRSEGFTIRDNIGALVRHGGRFPAWADKFIEAWSVAWDHVGLTFFRMEAGDIMPAHSDQFHRYVERFALQGREHAICRTVLFLEDWKSGHYLEVDGTPIVSWKAGDLVTWQGSVPHMAANLGTEPRYTLQITGVAKDEVAR